MTNLIETIQDTEEKAEELVVSAQEEALQIVQQAQDAERSALEKHKMQLTATTKSEVAQFQTDLDTQAKQILKNADATVQKLQDEASNNMRHAVDLIVNHITQKPA